jgi:hypothetical protein
VDQPNVPHTDAEAGPLLHLARHVQACRVDEQIILLDLKRGRYLAVSGVTFELVHGSSLTVKRSPASVDVVTTLRVLAQRLAVSGLLADNPIPARFSRALQEPTRSFDVEEAALQPRTTVACATRLLICATRAAVSIRVRSLIAIATVLERRRACQTHRPPPDPAAISMVAATYEHLRPLALTARDQCLQDSLALVHFMAADDLHPRWVIGVKTRPFGAHAWVQHDDMVLNDQHEHVRRFIPILVV